MLATASRHPRIWALTPESDNCEGLLSFIEVFGKALLLSLVSRSEVLVVVADLEEAPNEATQQVQIVVRHLLADRTFGDHQPCQHAKQATRLLINSDTLIWTGIVRYASSRGRSSAPHTAVASLR